MISKTKYGKPKYFIKKFVVKKVRLEVVHCDTKHEHYEELLKSEAKCKVIDKKLYVPLGEMFYPRKIGVSVTKN